MADLNEIAKAIADALSQIDGLQVHADVPEEITPPAAMVQLEGLTFDTTFSRGSDNMQWVVAVFTSKTHSRAGQRKLFQYIDGSGGASIKAAIEADMTLGGKVMVAEVVSVRQPGVAVFGDIQYYGAEFVVNVEASGE